MIYYVVHKVTHQSIWSFYRTCIYIKQKIINTINKEHVQPFTCRNKNYLAWKSEAKVKERRKERKSGSFLAEID